MHPARLPDTRHARLFELIRQGNLTRRQLAKRRRQIPDKALIEALARLAARSLRR